MNTDKIKKDDLSLSDEDRLLDGKSVPAKTNTAAPAYQKQTKKDFRHKLVDANRMRAHSMDGITRLTQTTLPFSFGRQISSADTSSTMTSIPNRDANVGDTVKSSIVSSAIDDTFNGAGTSSTSNVKQIVESTAQIEQKPPDTLHTHERPATLKDVKHILDANNAISGATPPSTLLPILRPHLNATSTPNKTGGAGKKRRRGGKKYKEQMARKAEREKSERNNTSLSSAGATNPQKQQPNAQTQMNVVNRDAKPNLQGPKTTKRARVTGGTPPEVDHKHKNRRQANNSNAPMTSTARPSTADAVIEANLVVAVIDSPAPSVILPLDKAKYNALYESINNTLFSDIEKCSVIPTFDENKHVRGVMKIKCSTQGSKAWLIDAIGRTAPLWENMQLKVVDFDKLPQQNRILGLFPNCKFNAEQIRRMLNAMNPHVNVGCWTILSSKTTDKGAHVAFGVDKLQLDMLTANRFKLFFGAGSAIFNYISKKTANGQQQRVDESAMDIQTTDLEESDDDDEITITINNVANGTKQEPAAVPPAQELQNPGAEGSTVANAVPTATNTNNTSHNPLGIAVDVTNSISAMEIEMRSEHGATQAHAPKCNEQRHMFYYIQIKTYINDEKAKRARALE